MARKHKAEKNTAENRSSNKMVTAVGILFAVITFVAVFLIAKDYIFIAAARNAVIDSDLEKADTFADFCSGEEAEILGRYIDLRLEISAEYAALRTNFDRHKVESWQKTASELKNSNISLGEEIDIQLADLSGKLDVICTALAQYDTLRPDVLHLFDIFNETNRLYTKNENGQNTVFTISNELAAIISWECTAKELDYFLSNTPSGEKMYLFTFFVKEALGEATDLRDSILKFAEQGYDLNTPIRVTGDLHRTFPSIRNSDGSTLNLQHKDTYEECMYRGMCTALAETLGEYCVTE